ncbi:TPA: HNH endonuclease [Streptococcus suis]|nr:HNH endonuclease [Streptococcus suis]
MTFKKVRQSLKSSHWEKFRSRTLKRDKYLCQESLRYGLEVQAEMVHHIYPVSEFPELEFVSWNVISLTNKVHGTFHDRKNDKVIGQGLYWQRKRKKEFEQFFEARSTPPHNKNSQSH